MYDVRLERPIIRVVRKLPVAERERLIAGLEVLRTTPRGLGKKIKKLTNVKHGYRLRVGDWRVLYLVIDAEHRVTVYHVDRRDKAYK